MNLKVGDKVKFNPENNWEDIREDVGSEDYDEIMYRHENDEECKINFIHGNGDIYLDGMDCSFNDTEVIKVSTNKWKGKPR